MSGCPLCDVGAPCSDAYAHEADEARTLRDENADWGDDRQPSRREAEADR